MLQQLASLEHSVLYSPIRLGDILDTRHAGAANLLTGEGGGAFLCFFFFLAHFPITLPAGLFSWPVLDLTCFRRFRLLYVGDLYRAFASAEPSCSSAFVEVLEGKITKKKKNASKREKEAISTRVNMRSRTERMAGKAINRACIGYYCCTVTLRDAQNSARDNIAWHNIVRLLDDLL